VPQATPPSFLTFRPPVRLAALLSAIEGVPRAAA